MITDELIEIHTTDRTTYKQCRQKWDFQSNIRYNQEPVRPVDALWLGSGFHEGVGEYYNPEYPKRELDRAVAHFENYVATWVQEQRDITEEAWDWSQDMLRLGTAMIQNYVDLAKKEDKFDVMWVEREFHIPILDADGVPIKSINGQEVVYSFRVDGLVIDKHGRIWILEHKTRTQFDSKTEYLLFDDQPGSYLWGLNQVLEPEILTRPIEGVIYSFAKKKIPAQVNTLKAGGFSVAKNQDTTPAIVKQTFTDAFGKYAQWDKSYKDFYQFVKSKENNFVRRETVRRNYKEIENLGQAIRFEVHEMTNDPPIYRTPSAFNCNFCPFVGPCLIRWEGGDYEETLLRSGLYRERGKPYALAGARE